MTKYLILGANGQLGRALQKALPVQRNNEVIAVDYPAVDIGAVEQVMALVEAEQPQVVFNAAAYTNVDKAESDANAAWLVNAVGAQNIALACRACSAIMVHVSTDYVFAGDNIGRAYSEEDVTCPQGIYGRSKLAGERLVAHILPNSIIVRTAWLYGDGNNFVRTMLRLAKSQNNIRVVNDQSGCPTYAKDFAHALINLAHKQAFGLYHFVNKGYITWYDFAAEIFKQAGYNINLQSQSSDELNRAAKRPIWSVLDTRLYEMVTNSQPRNWQEALCEYLKEEKINGSLC